MTRDPPLQDPGALHITGWLPDETLFSLCSREHVLSGAKLASVTTLRLFGDNRLGSYHDMPAELDYFVRITHGEFGGSAREICRDHTLLPFYLPWRTPEEQMRVLARASVHCSGPVKGLLGIPSSRFGAQHPLKFCPKCMELDQAGFGVAYWHVDHQIPAVWTCPIHCCPLLKLELKRIGIGRFLWGLPTPQQSISIEVTTADDWVACKEFGKLVSAAMHRLKDTNIDYVKLNRTYRHELGKCGLIKGQRSLCLHEIAKRYVVYLEKLKILHEFEHLPLSIEGCLSHLAHVLYPNRESKHPLRHLLFIGWLFDDWETFWSVYSTCSKSDDSKNIASLAISYGQFHQQANDLALRLISEGRSTTEVARACGVDVHTIQSWAVKEGISVRVRNDTRRRAIIANLLRGGSKSGVAEHCGVSVQTVTRVLSSEVGLHARWREALLQHTKTQARKRWLSLKNRNPKSGNKQLRMLDRATYAWLYRNDRRWFVENSAPRIMKASSSRVDWQQRDDELVRDIQAATLGLRNNGSTEKFTPQELCRAVPALYRFASKMDRLPQTKKLLDHYTSRRRNHSSNKKTI